MAELEAALAAADAERSAQRQQLARLKQQMLNEQEDEEDKIRCVAVAGVVVVWRWWICAHVQDVGWEGQCCLFPTVLIAHPVLLHPPRTC